MTKSFVALAIFKLSDQGKLSLDDLVAKYLPEFRHVRPPTSDSPLVVRHPQATNIDENVLGDSGRHLLDTKLTPSCNIIAALPYWHPPASEIPLLNEAFIGGDSWIGLPLVGGITLCEQTE